MASFWTIGINVTLVSGGVPTLWKGMSVNYLKPGQAKQMYPPGLQLENTSLKMSDNRPTMTQRSL